jgi:hypothetical protein
VRWWRITPGLGGRHWQRFDAWRIFWPRGALRLLVRLARALCGLRVDGHRNDERDAFEDFLARAPLDHPMGSRPIRRNHVQACARDVGGAFDADVETLIAIHDGPRQQPALDPTNELALARTARGVRRPQQDARSRPLRGGGAREQHARQRHAKSSSASVIPQWF